MDKMIDVIGLCYEIDVVANKLYKKIASYTEGELQNFWIGMSKEEKGHVDFWLEVLEFAKENRIPNIFSNLERVISDLTKSLDKSEKLLSSIDESTSLQDYFICAYWMEFYLLHPSFESLFEYFSNIIPDINPLDEYNNHIEIFADSIKRFGENSKELELLGVTLSQLWDKNKELSKENRYDYLTNLLNRKTFINQAHLIIDMNKRNKHNTGIFYIDVDDFKSINDTKGHAYGDIVLQEIAKVLRDSTRVTDLVARYGGDEFIIILSNANQRDALVFGKKLQDNIKRANSCLKDVSISIGCSITNEANESTKTILEELISNADDALYQAKKSGKNQIMITTF